MCSGPSARHIRRHRGRTLVKPANAELERGLPRERGLSLEGRAVPATRAASSRRSIARARAKGRGEDEADDKPRDGPQRQFAIEETAVALHLLGPGRAMAVQPLAVTLQFLVRGGDDAAREPERPVGAGNLRLDLVRQMRHDLGSHSSSGRAQGSGTQKTNGLQLPPRAAQQRDRA